MGQKEINSINETRLYRERNSLQLNTIYGKYVSFLSAFFSTTQEGNGEGMNGREMTEEDERRIKFQAEVQFSCDCYHSYWVIAIMDQDKVEDVQSLQ